MDSKAIESKIVVLLSTLKERLHKSSKILFNPDIRGLYFPLAREIFSLCSSSSFERVFGIFTPLTIYIGRAFHIWISW